MAATFWSDILCQCIDCTCYVLCHRDTDTQMPCKHASHTYVSEMHFTFSSPHSNPEHQWCPKRWLGTLGEALPFHFQVKKSMPSASRPRTRENAMKTVSVLIQTLTTTIWLACYRLGKRTRRTFDKNVIISIGYFPFHTIQCCIFIGPKAYFLLPSDERRRGNVGRTP